MKTLRRFCTMFVLTLVLTLSAFAGDISTTVVSEPPPPDSQTAATGEMSTSVTATDSVTAVALSLLQSLPPLF